MVKRIPPFRLVPEPLTEEARSLPGFKWAGKEVGTRHQLGGEPAWLQGPDVPTCAGCNQPMTFYGQLDSVNDDLCLADAGLLYVFACLTCNTTASLIQC